MPSTSQTAISPEGYLFQIPSLGLPNPAGEWVRVCVAIGTKDESIALVENISNAATQTPLRSTNGVDSYFDVEYEGAIWVLPASLPSETTSRPEIFSIKVKRLSVTTARAGARTQLPNDVDWIFLDKQGQELEYGSFERTEEEKLLELHESLGGRFSLAALRIFTSCINPTPAQRQPPLPRAASFEDAATRTVEGWSEAGVIWRIMSPSYLNKAWLRKLHDEAIAAGLRKESDVFDPKKPIAMFRVHPESNFDDLRSLDYALCNMEGDCPPPHQAKWLPFPEDAADPVWIRCGVNLFRFNLGRRLFSKEEWPPHAAS